MYLLIGWWVNAPTFAMYLYVHTSIKTLLDPSTYSQNFAHKSVYEFVGWLSYVYSPIQIHAFNVNPSAYPFIQTHLSNPLNLSIHLYTIHLYTQTLTHLYIGLYIHISIYPYMYILYCRGKSEKRLTCMGGGNFQFFQAHFRALKHERLHRAKVLTH